MSFTLEGGQQQRDKLYGKFKWEKEVEKKEKTAMLHEKSQKLSQLWKGLVVLKGKEIIQI